jgi:hypothetical protein
MNTRFKVFTSYNILQYLCDFIHVLIFVTVSKCRKSSKLMNIVIVAEICPFGPMRHGVGVVLTRCKVVGRLHVWIGTEVVLCS